MGGERSRNAETTVTEKRKSVTFLSSVVGFPSRSFLFTKSNDDTKSLGKRHSLTPLTRSEATVKLRRTSRRSSVCHGVVKNRSLPRLRHHLTIDDKDYSAKNEQYPHTVTAARASLLKKRWAFNNSMLFSLFVSLSRLPLSLPSSTRASNSTCVEGETHSQVH